MLQEPKCNVFNATIFIVNVMVNCYNERERQRIIIQIDHFRILTAGLDLA